MPSESRAPNAARQLVQATRARLVLLLLQRGPDAIRAKVNFMLQALRALRPRARALAYVLLRAVVSAVAAARDTLRGHVLRAVLQACRYVVQLNSIVRVDASNCVALHAVQLCVLQGRLRCALLHHCYSVTDGERMQPSSQDTKLTSEASQRKYWL